MRLGHVRRMRDAGAPLGLKKNIINEHERGHTARCARVTRAHGQKRPWRDIFAIIHFERYDNSPFQSFKKKEKESVWPTRRHFSPLYSPQGAARPHSNFSDCHSEIDFLRLCELPRKRRSVLVERWDGLFTSLNAQPNAVIGILITSLNAPTRSKNKTKQNKTKKKKKKKKNRLTVHRVVLS